VHASDIRVTRLAGTWTAKNVRSGCLALPPSGLLSDFSQVEMMGARYTNVVLWNGKEGERDGRSGPDSDSVEEIGRALSQSIWAHQSGEPGLFPALMLTKLHFAPGMSTGEQTEGETGRGSARRHHAI